MSSSALGSSTGGKHVKVVIRTRPTANFAQDILNFGKDKKSLNIHIPKNNEGGFINNQQEKWDFRFDQILHNASQDVVYDECGAPILKGLLEGYNGTPPPSVFLYSFLFFLEKN
jgi:kinesin family protein 6/9